MSLLGFYELENIKSRAVVNIMIYISLRFNLQNFGGKTSNRSSNLMGKKSGAATIVLVEQRKALATHCHGHSFSQVVEDLAVSFKNLSDTMRTLKEIRWREIQQNEKIFQLEWKKIFTEIFVLLSINFWRLRSCINLLDSTGFLFLKDH